MSGSQGRVYTDDDDDDEWEDIPDEKNDDEMPWRPPRPPSPHPMYMRRIRIEPVTSSPTPGRSFPAVIHTPSQPPATVIPEARQSRASPNPVIIVPSSPSVPQRLRRPPSGFSGYRTRRLRYDRVESSAPAYGNVRSAALFLPSSMNHQILSHQRRGR